MTQKIVYISGPMSGYPGKNYDAFHQAEKHLRALGYDVLNPAIHPEQETWADFLRLDLAEVLRANAVAVLPGWEVSRGARLEVHVALELGVPVRPVHLFTGEEAAA